MFHQPHNTFGRYIYNAKVYEAGTEYLSHFHKSYELLYCYSDSLRVSVEAQEYTMKQGDFLLVFPFQSHAFTVGEGERVWVGAFSGDYIPAFDTQTQGRLPVDARFRVDADLQAFLQPNLLQPSTPSDLAIKGCLYLLCEQFLRGVAWRKSDENRELTVRMIRYIEENFTEQITLRTAAQALGFHYQYLSRVFSRSVQMNFRALINQYRFDYACRLLEEQKMTVTEAALAAGFQSTRNFNRVYREKMGVPPRAHRNREKN